ncbi:MAG: S-methyl-5'-thioadenosine phosphorylase [Nitrospinae bacterium]|nr:S-methyl-5'-thioadenosine phosphorylase [Nitrospinota bacterium]
MSDKIIGIIGGSGLYKMAALKNIEELDIDTPFGKPSDKLVLGEINGQKVVFIPRHAVGHKILPSEINYRANIYALKMLKVETILSVSAVGSMKKEIEPGHIVIPHQFYDHTKGRKSTFFGDGIVAHVPCAEPICLELAAKVNEAAKRAGATVHYGGTYINMEGPQFSTKAESNIYRQWGVDVIGMTNATEAKLAKEAEICYCTIALSTDYDCWHEEEESVTLDAILEIIHNNVTMAQAIIIEVLKDINYKKNCGCGSIVEYSIVTDKSTIPEKTKENLKEIIGKYL